MTFLWVRAWRMNLNAEKGSRKHCFFLETDNPMQYKMPKNCAIWSLFDRWMMPGARLTAYCFSRMVRVAQLLMVPRMTGFSVLAPVPFFTAVS